MSIKHPRNFRRIVRHAQRASLWFWTPDHRWLVFLAAALVALATFLELGEELLEQEELAAVDAQILRYVANLRRPWLTIPAIDITALGSLTLLSLAALAAALPLLQLGDLRGAAQLLVAISGAGVWTLLTKRLFSRARPDLEHRLIEVQGYSFPSGHAAGAAALYVTLAIVVGRHVRSLRGRVWLLAGSSTLALLIGLSRVYLGVHYASDVASGLTFGTGWALLLTALFEWRRSHGRRA